MNTKTNGVSEKEKRQLLISTGLETFAVLCAVTGLAIASVPLTSVAIIPALVGTLMLKNLLSKKENQEVEAE
jgi:hypothetical protein